MANAAERSSFGSALRRLRSEAGLTQEALAERAAMSARGLQKLERGETLPYPATVLRLGEALHLTAEQRAGLQSSAARPRRARPLTTDGAGVATPERHKPTSADRHGSPSLRHFSEGLAGNDLGSNLNVAWQDRSHRGVSRRGGEDIAFTAITRAPEYEKALTEIEPLALARGDPRLLGALYNRLGYCQWANGELGLARATWSRAADLCDWGGIQTELAAALALLQWCRLAQGELGQVLLCHEQTVEATERATTQGWHVWALAASAAAYALRGRRIPALAAANEALAFAESCAEPAATACALSILSAACTATGDQAAGQVHGASAVHLARRPLEQLLAQTALGWALCRSSSPGSEVAAEAVALLLPLPSEAEDLRVRPVEIEIRLRLGESLAATGQIGRARAALETMMARAETAGMRLHVAVGYRLLAEISLANPAADSLAVAAAHFASSIDGLDGLQADGELAQALVGYARLHRRRGAPQQAAECLSRALQIFDHLSIPRAASAVRDELAALRLGSPEHLA